MTKRDLILPGGREEHLNFKLTSDMLESLVVAREPLVLVALKYGLKREDVLVILRAFLREGARAIERDEYVHNTVPSKPVDVALEAVVKPKPRKKREIGSR